MPDPIIRVEGLSKKYVLGSSSQARSLRELVSSSLEATIRRLGQGGGSGESEFWALRDVNFEVNRGDVVGIVGRNGAGKSTLLKVLSRITPPTSGRIHLKGRVASLLEVGTGFHPELSGRENIYLNGAMLGMRRMEIKRKFEEIVAFSEVERFLDTPVKRYSSGMYVRLAFAVAAHLEPEILIVDEVLAVGDAEFQKKCLGKMKEVSRERGRTVLFVSHNMAAINSMCKDTVLLSEGTVECIGPTRAVIERYFLLSEHRTSGKIRVCGEKYDLTSFAAANDNGQLPATLSPGHFTISFVAHDDLPQPGVHLYIEDEAGTVISAFDTDDYGGQPRASKGQEITARISLPRFPFTPGTLRARLVLKDSTRREQWEVPTAIPFKVSLDSHIGSRALNRKWHGLAAVETSVSWAVAELGNRELTEPL